MKTFSVRTFHLHGIEAIPAVVSASVEPGSTSFKAAGISESAAKETKVRVLGALAHAGLKPEGRFDVAVDPPVPYGSPVHLDLPIALAVAGASGAIPETGNRIFAGEISLDGALRRIAGVLPAALAAKGCPLVLPVDSAGEAAAVPGVSAFAASSLGEVVAFLRGEISKLARAVSTGRPSMLSDLDLAQVSGFATAKRALEIAAAGGHGILLIGPTGSGKSLLARCLPGILPPMTEAEALEAAAIWSAAGKLDGQPLLSGRPFRAPHHDVAVAGLVGGGSVPRPGEASLAHHGVLLLDELPEFKRAALEALRQPMEDGRVVIVRQKQAIVWPSRFQLVGAMNPCPCSYRGSALRTCVCSDEQVCRYIGRISSLLLDRFDLHVEIPHVDYRTLRSGCLGEPSASVRERVAAARALQRRRSGRRPGFVEGDGTDVNARMRPRQIVEHCGLPSDADRHLEACVKRFALSGAEVHGILRVARTIADLEGKERIGVTHVAEAVAFRRVW